MGNGLDGLAGRDSTHQGQFCGCRRSMIDQLDRASMPLVTQDQPFLDQRIEMAHDAIGRLNVKRFPDLADRWPVAAGLDLVADELVNLPLPRG